MGSHNPIAGGPNYMAALCNAVQKTPGGYATAPPTGGTQISVRFSDDRLAILDSVCKESGWNRNQVINAFVDRGLFELFHYIDDKVVKGIMELASSRLIPTYNPGATIMKDLTSYTRFRIFPAPQVFRPNKMPVPLEGAWVLRHVDRERDTFSFDEATVSGHGLPPLHVSHIEKLWPDTAEDSVNGMKNAMLLLNVQVALTESGPKLLPVSDQAAVIKRR